MNHLTEDELVLHYYGETRDSAEHLRLCEHCRLQYQDLQRFLNVVDAYRIPERDPDYENRLWAGLRARIAMRPAWSWKLDIRKLAIAGALAMIVIAAFTAGRFSARLDRQLSAQDNRVHRERVLLGAVGEHLDRSQFFLAEVANSEGGLRLEDIDVHDLLETNRLYRQSAAIIGDRTIGDVLDDLERMLLEVEHGSTDAESIRDYIRREGLLFKVRVIGSELRERQRHLNEEEGERF